MENYLSKEHTTNFSLDDKAIFRDLVDKYSGILFNEKTDHVSNVKQKATWTAIHAEFNALSVNARTLRQLQAKFDNMKRTARKDASQERRAKFATGGGPPGPSVSEDTEWLWKVMPLSMDGLTSVVDDDVINVETVGEVEAPAEKTHSITASTPALLVDLNAQPESSEVSFDPKAPASLVRTRVSKPLRRPAAASRFRKPADARCELRQHKIRAMQALTQRENQIFRAKLLHLMETRNEKHELYQLKKRKLQLEISILEKKFN